MKRFVPLIVILVLALALAFLLDDFVRQVIVGPLLYALWIGGLILRSLPQFVFWGLFVLVALIIVVRSLDRDFSVQRRRRRGGRITRGYVASWQRQLRQADAQPYFRWRLARSLAKLSQEIMAPTDPVNPDERQSQAEMMAALPPEIAAYFQAEVPREPAVISRWYRRQPERTSTALDLDPGMVVDYLEKEVG